MSNGTIDLRGNTNFVVLKNLLHQDVVPRTNLAAVDLTVANGLAVTGSTLYANLATASDLTYGTSGQLVDAAVLKPVLDAKQASFTVGDLLENTSGTLNRKRYMDIISGTSMTTRSITPIGATVAVTAYVLEPGNAYKVQVGTSNKWFATTSDFKSSSETWGLEGHIELYLAGTGYVHTDDNVVLSTPLEPDAVNNCTVRFHDGKAIISVEDTIAGYIVITATGSSNGSLAYGLANNVGEYISVNDTLTGTTLDLSGVTTYNGEKHVVGNGYNDTVVGGTVTCTNKTTFSNLSMNGVVVAGGTMTLGDVYIPNGATVSVSGGGLAIKKVSGAGSESVIDLGGGEGNTTRIVVLSGSTTTVSSCKVVNGKAGLSYQGGGFQIYGTINLVSCNITSNTAAYGPGVFVAQKGYAIISACTITGNDSTDTLAPKNDIAVQAEAEVADSVIGGIMLYDAASVSLHGSNAIDTIKPRSAGAAGSVTLTSGASINLTSSIAPGGGITVLTGGCTVNGHPIVASTYTSISSDGTTVPPQA